MGSAAIDVEPSHVLFSNRSACYCGLHRYNEARSDAQVCIRMKRGWGKGYGRLGAALHGLGDFDGAIKAYKAGLKVEPDLEMLKCGLADARAESGKKADVSGGRMGFLRGL